MCDFLTARTRGNPPPQNRTDGLRRSQARHSKRHVRRLEPIKGPFEVELLFRWPDKTRMGDLDNGIKPLMDWLQWVELIEDDRFCDRILAQWGRVPLDVRGPPTRPTQVINSGAWQTTSIASVGRAINGPTLS